jgi:hypothetical protein
VVAGAGLVAAAAVALGLAAVGGPGEARREQRDRIRLEHMREIAGAFDCHARSAPSVPEGIEGLSPACLPAARAGELRDPASGAPYRVEHPEPDVVRVCAAFETDARRLERYPAAPPFDPDAGCISAALAADPG